MKYDHFCFWLQGYFELLAAEFKDDKTLPVDLFLLSSQRTACIREKIKQVKDSHPFVSWLDGALLGYSLIRVPEGQNWVKEQHDLMDEIANQLAKVFEQDIDPKMPGDKESLKKIHSGRSKPRPGGGRNTRLMC